MMTRRQAIKSTAIATAVAATAPAALAQSREVTASASAATQVVSGPFTLPPLPYSFDALEPHIDARTMEIHHDRHHKAYVDNLNKALAEFPELGKKSVDDLVKDLNSIPEKVRTPVRNNAGGHYNHSLFWQMMKKGGGGEPRGELANAITQSFGSFSDFKTKISEAATKVFGSGWAWLVWHAGNLTIESSPNQDSPLIAGPVSKELASFVRETTSGTLVSARVPLLGLDVWEHAYYLKYQNKRADYIAAWWNVVNWDFVAERYARVNK
jgi:Fe-Mn family superoxide dismutase